MTNVAVQSGRVQRNATIIAAIIALIGTLLLAQSRGALEGIGQAWLPMFVLAGATLVSEDLTCVAAGELIRRGQISPLVGVLGCFAGIYLGDLALWALGRAIGPRVLRWKWVKPKISTSRLDQLINWFDRRGAIAVLSARFVPGLRLPVYLGAGFLQRDAAKFAIWTLIASAIWTPLVVLLVALTGDRFVVLFEHYVGGGWVSVASVALAGAGVLRLTGLLVVSERRARVIAAVSKIWRWEFWPTWLVYLPILPWIAWLTIRHRSFMLITAANPGIPLGGFVGESKSRIMAAIRHPWAIETTLIAPGELSCRVAHLPYQFPQILKPDVGQRGQGVKLVRSILEASEYLRLNPHAIIAQPFHAGPFEAGIFYYRIPGDAHGRILSTTDKVFPELTGDGESTIEQLIWSHPRYRMQAATFCTRHASVKSRILARGERFRLAIAGNHCQGTMFCDGSHLITPQLERKIDEIAQSFNGFYFGRFDVRYSDVERLKSGEDVTLIELNGITSESTNIYDPTWPLWRACRVLMTQWRILFEVARANRDRGVLPSRPIDLLRALRDHFWGTKPSTIAD